MSKQTYIGTYSGKEFDFINPKPEHICIEDIAHALSNICRFTGHVQTFYSVGQHSVLVASLFENDPELAFYGLMHDSTEAYVNDLSTPLKALLRDYQKIENTVWEAIANKFYMPFELPREIKAADLRLVLTEDRDLNQFQKIQLPGLMPLETKIEAWAPNKTKQMFLDKFHELYPIYLKTQENKIESIFN